MAKIASYLFHGIEIETRVSNRRIRSLLDEFWCLNSLKGKSHVLEKLKLELIETSSTPSAFRERGKLGLHFFQFGVFVRRHGEGLVLKYSAEATFCWEPNERKLVGWLRPSAFDPPEKFLYRILMPVVRIVLEFFGLFSIHAGAVSKGGRGIILIAGGGGGKSTITFALVRKGFKFLADDRPFLRENGSSIEILSVPERIALRPATERLFPEVRTLCPDVNEFLGKRLIEFRDLPFNCLVSRALPGLMVLLDRRKRGKIRVQKVSKQEILSLFLSGEFFVLPRRSEKMARQLKTLGKLIDASESYRLTYPESKMDEMVSTIERLHTQQTQGVDR